MVLAGGGGSTFLTKAAGRTGPHLGKVVTNAVPLSTIRSINEVLGANFVTKYGTRRGIIAIRGMRPGRNILQTNIRSRRLSAETSSRTRPFLSTVEHTRQTAPPCRYLGLLSFLVRIQDYH